MNSHELSLEMRGQLGDRKAVTFDDALDFVAIILAVGGLFEVEEPGVPAGYLDTLVP